MAALGQANASASISVRSVVYGSAVGRMVSPDGYLPSTSCFLRGGVSQNATNCDRSTAFTTWIVDQSAGTWSKHDGVNCYPSAVRHCASHSSLDLQCATVKHDNGSCTICSRSTVQAGAQEICRHIQARRTQSQAVKPPVTVIPLATPLHPLHRGSGMIF